VVSAKGAFTTGNPRRKAEKLPRGSENFTGQSGHAENAAFFRSLFSR
jgi:hypothetical protein